MCTGVGIQVFVSVAVAPFVLFPVGVWLIATARRQGVGARNSGGALLFGTTGRTEHAEVADVAWRTTGAITAERTGR